MREQILAGLLAIAAVLVATGVARFSSGGALIAAGILLGLWSWLVFGEVDDG
jgi:hypothetical protein